MDFFFSLGFTTGFGGTLEELILLGCGSGMGEADFFFSLGSNTGFGGTLEELILLGCGSGIFLIVCRFLGRRLVFVKLVGLVGIVATTEVTSSSKFETEPLELEVVLELSELKSDDVSELKIESESDLEPVLVLARTLFSGLELLTGLETELFTGVSGSFSEPDVTGRGSNCFSTLEVSKLGRDGSVAGSGVSGRKIIFRQVSRGSNTIGTGF